VTQATSFANKEEFCELLLSMIVGLHLPFRAVNNIFFQQLVLRLSHMQYQLPAPTSIRTQLVTGIAQIERQLLSGLVDGSKVSLSLDCWTSPFRQAFLGVVANYIDSSWNLKHDLIGFEHLEGIHSGLELAKVLMSCLMRYTLEGRVIAITTDNASNNKTLLKETEEMVKEFSSEDGLFEGKIQHIPCLSHIIQLGLKALLGHIRLKPTNDEIQKVWNEEQQMAELEREAKQKGIAFTLAKVSYSNIYCNLQTNY
jgi:hypothetical protein